MLKNDLLFSILKFIIGWPLSAITLFFIGKLFLSKKDIFLSIETINIPLFLYSVLCFLSYFFIRSYVWKKILEEFGYSFSIKETSFLWSTAELKRYIPGNIWSFLGRSFLFSQRGVDNKTIIKSLFIEAQWFVLSCLIVSTLAFPLLKPHISFYNEIYIFYSLFISSVTVFFIYSQKIKRTITHATVKKILHFLPEQSPKNNITILLFSLMFLTFFGLGTYFAITSVIYLSPLYLFQFIGFFVFSLVAGYLSVLTPMGLGVREGIITIGLTGFISQGPAAFASVFGRGVLIFSDLLFFMTAYLWNKSKSSPLITLERFIIKNKWEVFLLIGIGVFILYFTSVSFLRYDNYYTGRFDLGNMHQTVWNTKHGNIFQLTNPNGTNTVSRLAFHADFILIFLAPFYFIWEDARMLLLIQSVVVGFGAVFVFLIANFLIKNQKISLLFAVIYLFNPSLQYSVLYDFHPVTFATTFLLASFYYMIIKRYLYFLFFGILAALTKEQIWFIFGLLGIYLAINDMFHKKPLKHFFIRKAFLIGISTAVFSVLFGYFLLQYAVPQARGGQHFAISYYSEFGESKSEIINNILFRPDKTLGVLFEKDRMSYLRQLFLPFGFLPLLTPFILIFSAPDLLINLLSNNDNLHQIYYQYTAAITPFLVIATIYSVKKISEVFPRFTAEKTAIILMVFTMYSSYQFGPLPGSKSPNVDMITKPESLKEIINKTLSQIPPELSVASTNNIGSHLSGRKNIYTLPNGVNNADVIIFLTKNENYPMENINKEYALLLSLKNNPRYSIEIEKNNFIVFRNRRQIY